MILSDTAVALLTVVNGSVYLNPESISVVTEDEIILTDLPQLADGFLQLFGLI